MKSVPAMIVRMFLLLLLCIMLQLPVLSTVWPASAAMESAQPQNFYAFTDNGTTLKYPVMPQSPEQKKAEALQILMAPLAPVDGQAQMLSTEGNGQGGNFSLLPYLNYVPAERNQNPNCGNCWVWTGTGVMEIALAEQKDIKDRFSIQYFNSTYQNGTGPNWACCGGNPNSFVTIYSTILGKAIPWSNAGASFRDGPQTCAAGTSVPAGTITTTPYYRISSIGPAQLISTHNLGDDRQAIMNIKSILNQNKAVYFAYGLASTADWLTFQNWWDDSLETVIWNQGYSCGKPWTMTGGWHAVLCVGYNDEDPNPDNHYWLILNSWGAPAGRPNGLFRIRMYGDYDCADSLGNANTLWWTIPVTFADNNQARQIDTPAGIVTISTEAGSLDAATFVDPAALPEGLPAGAILPFGAFSFTDNNLAPGATVIFTIRLPYPPAAGLQLWKFSNGLWVDCTSLLSGLDDGDNIIYITIRDGGQGDTDGTLNGSIVDPFALLIPSNMRNIGAGSHGSSPASIPAVQQYIPLPHIYVRSAAVAGENAAGAAQVTAEVANNGAAAGVGRIVLYIDGREANSRNINLPAGGTAAVNFDVTGIAPGKHEVTVNDTYAGRLTVDGGIDPVFFIALAAFLAVAGCLFVLYLRRQN